MNVWCCLSLFFGCWNYCFPLTGWVFSAKRLEKPHRCGHWMKCLHFCGAQRWAEPKVIYWQWSPPPLFTHLLPHCKNRRKKHVFFGGWVFFLCDFLDIKDLPKGESWMPIPGAVRETPVQSMPGTPTARGGHSDLWGNWWIFSSWQGMVINQ